MKKFFDKFLKLFLLSTHNFLINFFTRIFLPQKIYASKDYYFKKMDEVRISTMNDNFDSNVEYNIPVVP